MKVFIVLIIIFIYITINNNEYFNNNLEWRNYRLGDIIKGFFTDNFNKKNKKYLDKLKTSFKGSLGHKYYEITKGKYNLNELYNLINQESKKINDFIDVCMHVRLGDVIIDGDNPNFLPSKYKDKNPFNYSLETYKKLLNELKNNYKVKKITIIGGIHRKMKKSMINESKKFVKNLENICKSYNIDVDFRLGKSPDEDFLLMSNAKIFIMAGGGYSKIISNYVSYKKNIVINPLNYE